MTKNPKTPASEFRLSLALRYKADVSNLATLEGAKYWQSHKIRMRLRDGGFNTYGSSSANPWQPIGSDLQELHRFQGLPRCDAVSGTYLSHVFISGIPALVQNPVWKGLLFLQ